MRIWATLDLLPPGLRHTARLFAECVARSMYPCVEVDPDLVGTRTVFGMPGLSCQAATFPLTLPQNDGCVERTARNLSRVTSQCMYAYGDVPAFDMPMADAFSADLSAP